MSMGVGGFAHLIDSNDQYVTYSYGGFNLNREEFQNSDHIEDGKITISRDAFTEPYFHGDHKAGKYKAEYDLLFDEKKILVKNCSGCWHMVGDGVDSTALSILFKIFREYQSQNELPGEISIYK